MLAESADAELPGAAATQVLRTAARPFFIRTHHGAAGTMAPGQQLTDSAGRNPPL